MPDHATLPAWRRPIADLYRVWRGPRAKLRPLPAFTPWLVVGWLVAIAVAALFVDAPAAKAMVGLPQIFRDVFGRITHIGASGWIFATTTVVCLAALVHHVRSRGLARARSGLIAGRALYVFTVCAVSGLISQGLKLPVGRPRPFLAVEYGLFGFHPFVFDARFASFPSGHAITAFAMATAVASLAPRLRIGLYAVAVLIAFSRMVLSAHYLSDVMAGALIGTLSAVLIRRMFARRRIVFAATAGRIGVRLLPRRRKRDVDQPV